MKFLKHIIWLTIAAIALYLFCMLQACNVTKAKKTFSSDSTRVIRQDSGTVKKSTEAEKSTGAYERQTLIYYRDTGISVKPTSVSFHQSSIDYGRLAAIINERGNYNLEKNKNTYDSSYDDKLDALRKSFEESIKNKQEKPNILSEVIGGVILFLAGAVLIKIFTK